jgi:hypothetical protein
MSKDTVVLVQNSAQRLFKVHDRVANKMFVISPGESVVISGNRGSEDDVIIGIMDPSISTDPRVGTTVGRFRFENPDIGHSWMKSDWSQYKGQYAMRGYGKLSKPYNGFDYVVQSSRDQKIATGKLPKHQKYIFGKANDAYDPAPAHPEKGIWAFKASDFLEDQYVTNKGFKIVAEHESSGNMLWKLNVVNLDWNLDLSL